MNVWEAKEVVFHHDPFCLNGIHETQELRKCPALEYSITNLLRKDKDYLEIWKFAIIVIHPPSRMKPCTLKGSKIKLDRIFLINFFKNTKGQTLPHKNAAHLFGWFIHRVKRKNDFVQ